MTASTLATRLSFGARLRSLNLLAHLGGAVLTVVYFHEVDPTAAVGGLPVTGAEIAYFVLAFGLLYAILRRVSTRWVAPLTQAGPMLPPGPAGDTARRRALTLPAFVALLSGGGWVAAAFIWGLFAPLLAGDFELGRSLSRMFGITFVAGPFVTAIVFFGSERLMRDELPRLFPGGELSAVPVPRLRVRARMVVVFLLLGLLPLAVLSVAALNRADALRTADAATAAVIIHNLDLLVIVLALGGMALSVGLALLVAASVARPLGAVQAAMAQVQRGELDVRCAVVSNDEIGAVAEGFNAMVQGLREREAIRETFGRYVSPEVRDEILAGRVSTAGAQREVTILFADLRNFTPWVEASPPAEVVADLNAYFSEMDAAIRAHGGLVLQFIGDEIEAVFGAPLDNPRHADDAVAAAREMSRRLEAWNAARGAAGKPPLRHGIGIHTGTVIAGNIGSAERLSYSLVGDAVNLASRIQALNKEFGTQMLVSGATHSRLASTAGLEAMPTVRVKGRSAEVSVFAIQPIGGASASVGPAREA
jgi:class 3 adenylate cyclase